MKFDLKAPCKNCPFRNDDTAIRFTCRERAEEIEESAYRNGFPCHLSADFIEDDDGEYEQGGYVFGENTQHCAGALLMYLLDGSGGNIPFERLSEAQQERVAKTLTWEAPVWEGPDQFLDSYGEDQ